MLFRSMYIERILDEINKQRIPNPQKFVPCTEEEVIRLEQVTHLSLPLAYKEFLRTMGNNAGTLLAGSDWLYPRLLRLQEGAREMLVEDNSLLQLPDDTFVFYMHQGYVFGFFRTSEGDDPPVYRYHEITDKEKFFRLYPSFTEFLLDSIREHADAVRQLRKTS